MAASRKQQSSLGVAPARASVNDCHVSTSPPETLYHEIKDKESGKVRRLAYHKLPGPRTHGIMYIPGLMDHKGGGRPEALHSFCQKYGFPYLRYDPSGLGESQGLKLTEASFPIWLEDAREMLLKVADGPQIVVCASLGGWLTSVLHQAHPEKFAGILMLAPTVNNSSFEEVVKSKLPPKMLKKYNEGEPVEIFLPDFGKFLLSKTNFANTRPFFLNLEPNTLPVTVPVRIIHGIKDKVVNYQDSLPLLHTFGTEDVQLTYLKPTSHTFHDDRSVEVIYDAILKLAAEVDKKAKL